MFNLSASEMRAAQTSADQEGPATLVINMIISTAVLTYLLWFSWKLAPDFFHFITCLSDL